MGMQQKINFVLSILEKGGFKARVVGGYVRDFLLRKKTNDIDVATTATPDQVKELFEKENCRVIPTGLAHGTVTVVKRKIHYEITTLRKDVKTDGRHAEVSFDSSWEEDAARRDFTFNALYLDSDGEVYDYYNGISDLKSRTVRFIGNPEERIKEDYLRILRYFRFSAQLDFWSHDRSTLDAIRNNADKISTLSKERIKKEMEKILECPNPCETLDLMEKTGVLSEIVDVDHAKMQKLRTIAGKNGDILELLFEICDTFTSRLFLFAEPTNFSRRLCYTRTEIDLVRKLFKRLPFNEINEENLRRNAIYCENKAAFQNMALRIFSEYVEDEENMPIYRMGTLLDKLAILRQTFLKGVYENMFPLRAADVIPFTRFPYEISELLTFVRKFWSYHLGVPSKDECLEYLKQSGYKI